MVIFTSSLLNCKSWYQIKNICTSIILFSEKSLSKSSNCSIKILFAVSTRRYLLSFFGVCFASLLWNVDTSLINFVNHKNSHARVKVTIGKTLFFCRQTKHRTNKKYFIGPKKLRCFNYPLVGFSLKLIRLFLRMLSKPYS